MTRIKVKVKARRSWPLKWRKGIENTVRWGIYRLGISQEDITILVRLKGRSSENDYGSCIQLTENKYIISLFAGHSLGRVISTIFHELTHVKQHLRDDFVMMERGAIWRSYFIVYDKKDYWQLPWEIEARESEKILRKEFANLAKNNS